MNLKRSLLVGATIATITLGGGGVAMAATNNAGTGNSGTSIVQKLSEKFGLNKDDVQAVFDADRAEMEANRETEQKDKLAQAVTDGKITQDQADHITSAMAEITSLRGTETKGSADTTVRDQVKAKMDALHTWATDNNVDMQLIMGGHKGGGPGFGGRPQDGNDDTSSSTTTN